MSEVPLQQPATTPKGGWGKRKSRDIRIMQREFCIDNLLVRIHFIIKMIGGTAFAQQQCRLGARDPR